MDAKVYDASPVASAVSAKCSLRFHNLCSFHVIWTGTQAGTLVIQTSNKDDPDESVGSTDWKNNAAVFPNNPAGAAGSTEESFWMAGSRWIRVLYQYTSGAGSVKMYFSAKEAG